MGNCNCWMDGISGRDWPDFRVERHLNEMCGYGQRRKRDSNLIREVLQIERQVRVCSWSLGREQELLKQRNSFLSDWDWIIYPQHFEILDNLFDTPDNYIECCSRICKY